MKDLLIVNKMLKAHECSTLVGRGLCEEGRSFENVLLCEEGRSFEVCCCVKEV